MLRKQPSPVNIVSDKMAIALCNMKAQQFEAALVIFNLSPTYYSILTYSYYGQFQFAINGGIYK